MRHGIAAERNEWDGPDETRPLTEKGNERVREIIAVLKKEKKLDVDAIFSSPYVRAHQTAEIAGKVLNVKVKTIDALACGAHLKSLKASLATPGDALPEKLMLVGHEPDCGDIIGTLIGDSEHYHGLKKAGIAFLQGSFTFGGMKLIWLLAPHDILKE
jgi:phosphohistidine phosphatase